MNGNKGNRAKVESLVARSSDHKPLLLTRRNRDYQRGKREIFSLRLAGALRTIVPKI